MYPFHCMCLSAGLTVLSRRFPRQVGRQRRSQLSVWKHLSNHCLKVVHLTRSLRIASSLGTFFDTLHDAVCSQWCHVATGSLDHRVIFGTQSHRPLVYRSACCVSSSFERPWAVAIGSECRWYRSVAAPSIPRLANELVSFQHFSVCESLHALLYHRLTISNRRSLEIIIN